jgi:HD-GYP domain-containing protein (c-di-GMP phosphodiesterase class II)
MAKLPRFQRLASKNLWIPVGSLKIGMFVSGLDRPWIETPFPLQGLYVKSLTDIDRLKLYCDKVEIDAAKSWVEIEPDTLQSNYPQIKSLKEKLVLIDQRGAHYTRHAEEEKFPLEAEIKRAKKVYSSSASLIGSVIEDIKNNRRFDYLQVQGAALEMVDSILRNSDALIWLSQLRKKDDYTYQHSINVSILMLNLGKHLSLTTDQLLALGTAGLLQDIGILLLPESLIQKKGGLTPEELTLARSHVNKGIELLSGQRGVTPAVLDTISQHHERYDGTGYPNRLKENQISLFGTIAGIADCYDAIVSERAHAAAKSSFQALMLLYELRGKSFNPAVIERFIQAIGIYPIGSIVELNSGEAAIVLEQRKSRRLQPKLLVVLDSEKKPYQQTYVLDLLENPVREGGTPYCIKDVLGAGAYGIDPAEYYLFEAADIGMGKGSPQCGAGG